MLTTTILLASFVSAAPPPARIHTEIGKFADTYQFTSAAGEFQITNDTDQTLAIRVTAARPTDRVLKAPPSLAPHASETITVLVTPQFESGIRLHGFPISVDGEEAHDYGQVRGFVQSLLNDAVPLKDFGVVETGDSPVLTVPIASDEDPNLKATRILDRPAFVEASVAPDGRSVSVSLKDTGVWGVQDGVVKVGLDGKQQQQAWIEVRADLHGEVVPFSNPFGFGVARKGKNNEYLIRLDDRHGTDFKIGELKLEGLKGTVSAEACTPAKSGCGLIRLVLSDAQNTGKLTGHVTVPLPEFGHDLSITVWGMLFKSDAVIADLNAESAAAASAEKTPDLASALKSAVTETPAPIIMPTPGGNGPLLKWSLQNELQTYGYIIYRADSESGSLRRINQEIIPALSHVDHVSVEYRWRDTTALPGHTYWYEIATVNLRGQRTSLTGRVKKTYEASGK